MKKQITIFLLTLAGLAGLSACGSDYDWWSGELEGASRINAVYSSGGAGEIIVPEQAGKLQFKSPFALKLGMTTPLPDCYVSFSAGDVDIAHQVSGFDRAFKGDTNSGKGCEALLGSGKPVEVDIYHAVVKRDDNGNVTLTINFRPTGSTGSSNYEFVFRGRKKGWF